MAELRQIASVLAGDAQWCVVEAACEDVLESIGSVPAVVTDPPYGIGEAAGKNKSRSNLAAAAAAEIEATGDLFEVPIVRVVAVKS